MSGRPGHGLHAGRIAAALLLAALSTHALANSKARTLAFAALPDWTGFWEVDDHRVGVSGKPANLDAGYTATGLSGRPPYNPEWEAKNRAYVQQRRNAPDQPLCAVGFPAIMDGAWSVFEVVSTPERTIFTFSTPRSRYIYTDGRSHPAPRDLWPTDDGDSVGHWEGDTLVIDTVARKAAPILFANLLSDQAHFVERIRKVGDQQLRDDMVIDDPVAFTKPWKVTLTYHRAAGMDRLLPFDCTENDRDPVVNGKFTLAPPH